MGIVAKEIKAMSQEQILAFENAGEVIIANHCLKLSDIKVLIFVGMITDSVFIECSLFKIVCIYLHQN